MNRKLAVMAIVTAMVCLSLASVSPSVGAGDVGGDVVEKLLSTPAGMIFEDIAWSDDGTIALAVGYDSNGDGRNAAWYYPDINTWASINNYPYPAGYTLNAVAWSTQNSMFYMAGETDGGSLITCYYITKGGATVTRLPSSGTEPTLSMNDIAVDVYGNALAVGSDDRVYFFHNSGGTWYPVNDADDALPNADYFGVDYESTYQRFYIVGEVQGGGEAMITYTNMIPNAGVIPASHINYLSAQLPFLPEFYSIAWNNDPNMPAADKYALVGGTDILIGIGLVEEGMQFYPGTGSYPNGVYHHITWDESTWEEASLISNVGTTSYLYQFINSSKSIVLLGQKTQPDTYNAVDYKPPASPSWGFVVGATGGYQINTNAFHSDTTITISSDMPHIFSMDMWKQSAGIGGASKFNTQVDVNTVYTFAIEINYTVGGVNKIFDGIDDVRIVLEAYYDEGSAGSFAEPTWATTDNRTRQFSFLWEEGVAGDSVNMVYPIGSPGTDEVQLVNGWRDPVGYGGDGFTFKLYFNVSFGAQMRAADGNGFGNGASSEPWDEAASFDDLNSWNIGMMIYDGAYPGAANASYEEFGVFQYSNITVSGSPAGNAPPGTVDQVLGNPSQITVTSNIPYYVNVSVPDLAKIGGGLPISANNVKVRSTSTLASDTNSMIRNMQAFPAANVNISVWGNTSQVFSNWMVAAPMNGTTAHGPWGSDYNGYATTDLLWYVTIPGATAEGIYQATITFRIGYY